MSAKKIALSLALLAVACGNAHHISQDTANTSQEPHPLDKKYPLHTIKLPPGFTISIFAEVNNARSMCLSPSGILYVGNRQGDKVYAVIDRDKDFRADEVKVIASGLDMPNGVAFRNGSLYVAEVSRILRFDNIEANLDNPPKPVVVYDKFPKDKHHGWKFIAFGPDGKLYVPVGAPCNICERLDNPVYSTITRLNPDGTGFEIYAHGVRNSVGFTWHPVTGDLWFTSNGRDMMGDDIPGDVLHHAPRPGMHFGYPYCHQGNIPDPEFGKKRPCSDFTPPTQVLGPHVAALGCRFYTGDMFPASYKNQLFIAEHGSWNRSKKIGYRITLVRITPDNRSAGYEVFAEGWLNQATDEAWGRPVDVQFLPDGSMLVSDDKANVIYRIAYKG
ncbi:MAG: sorbosone dehydrogenase family protein [Cytophagales bacterium]|nr:sorbosone dehydrogenase family protein [Bernardetiaceae bacterium]MDW8210081.1 sorbosone dehydrogenase family protein [Cytophagales bacterium]